MTFDQNQTATAIVDGLRIDAPADMLSARHCENDPSSALAIADYENLCRSNLMAVMGHDLKQPLQLISLVLELLAARTNNPEQRPRVQLAQAAVQRIGEGLDRLVLASRQGQPTSSPRPTTFPIADILQRIKPTWREHAMRGGVRLHVVTSSAYVVSDVEMLSTILGNLIGNAIKYAPRGDVLIGCRRVKNHLCIQVVDTGPGIPPERIDAVFAAFHQEDPTSAGFGLGLSIVQHTAAMLGHHIQVRSVLGKGSLFGIEVPLAPTALLSSCAAAPTQYQII
jgi:signal transduction histidine kinase